MFDTNEQRDKGFKFKVGAGKVIQGWDKGIPIRNAHRNARYSWTQPSHALCTCSTFLFKKISNPRKIFDLDVEDGLPPCRVRVRVTI